MIEPNTIKAAQSWPVSIFIAGNAWEAKTVCREYCDEVGYCVTVTETNYVYRDGDEAGVIVGLINYPRFPKLPAEIERHAFILAGKLRERLGQQSYSVQTPVETIWHSWREADAPYPSPLVGEQ